MSATLDVVRAAPGLAEYLGEVEELLDRSMAGHPGLVAEIGAEALTAGGKRLRPMLTFLSAPAGTRPSVAAGAAVELVHMATLVHDDLIDGARVRRGKAAAWTAYGADAARAAGDYIFARAFSELAARGDVDAVAILAEASLALARGEAHAAPPALRPGHDGRGLPRALRAQDRASCSRPRACSAAAAATTAGCSASRSRSSTTSSTARATRSRRARSPAPTCATARRRCR